VLDGLEGVLLAFEDAGGAGEDLLGSVMPATFTMAPSGARLP
jgi:hypothetical protein